MFENVTAQRQSCIWLWKDRKDRWSLASNLILLTTSEGQPYSLSLEVRNLTLGEGECLPKTQQVSTRVLSATMVCSPRKSLMTSRRKAEPRAGRNGFKRRQVYVTPKTQCFHRQDFTHVLKPSSLFRITLSAKLSLESVAY